MKNIKDEIAYQEELLEWGNIYLRLRRMIEEKVEKEPVVWNPVLENLEVTWKGIQKRLVVLYDR